MSVLLTDEAERVVDTGSEFNQTKMHIHGAWPPPHVHKPTDANDCVECHAQLFVAENPIAEPLAFVPPSQGKRIDEMRRLISQQESDLTEACRHIANQGMTIRGVRADLLGLLNKLRNGVEISFHDIANIIPDSPAEFKKAA